MAYHRTDNSLEIIASTKAKASLAVRFGIEDIHRFSTPKTPKLTGQLRADITKEVHGLNGKIRWGKKYAEYQERGYTSGPVKRYTTPGTGAHFAENAAMKVGRNKRYYFKKAGL